MLEGACHCGAVRFTVPAAPTYVNACNCSICRRYGTLWGYYQSPLVGFEAGAEGTRTETYRWGDGMLDFHRCRTCGCVTHWRSVGPEAQQRMAINARLLDPAALVGVPVRQGNGAAA